MAKKPNAQPIPPSFEVAVEELEAIIADMEGDKVPLEESLVKYERGTFLLQWCREVLGEVEKKIQVITQNAGKLAAEPLEPEGEQA